MRSKSDPALFSNTKTCTKCKGEYNKTPDNFPPRKLSRDGYDSWCRGCHRAITNEYHQNNKTRLNSKNKSWREENKEYRQEYLTRYETEHKEERKKKNSNYRANNREKVLLSYKSYRNSYPDRTKQANKRWANNNPEKVREISNRKRLRLLMVGGRFTAEDIKNLYHQQNGQCFYCGIVVGKSYHIDHYIPLSRGGSNFPTNLRIACPFCNLSKGNKMPEDFQRGLNESKG